MALKFIHGRRGGVIRLSFLKPTATRLVFLVEWILFVLIALLRGELEAGTQVLVAGYPLLFFYLVACALALMGEHTQQLARGWRLLALALALVGADQLSKVLIVKLLPHLASVPVIEGWLHLAHVRNDQGSWVLSTLDWQGRGSVMMMIVVPFFLLFAVFCHRYYVGTQRKSVWADVAFVGFFAGFMSWVCEMYFRGHIVDLIVLPGLLAADLKDLYVTIGAAAFCAEALDNPDISLRPKGWRRDGRDLLQLAARVASFSTQEVRGARRALMRLLGKCPEESVDETHQAVAHASSGPCGCTAGRGRDERQPTKGHES